MSLPLRHPDTLEELKGLIKAILDGSSPAIQQRYEADRTPNMPASYKDYVYSKTKAARHASSSTLSRA
jgi:hypothetical protein